jgi:CelD/BcsL family acetyltransferase involved in cellulose biosynthesis
MSESNLTLSPGDERHTGERAAQGDPLASELPSMASPPLAASEAVIALDINGDLATVERDWRAFERVADCTVFQSFDWLAKWQRHIGAPGGTVPAIVTGRDSRGALVFIFQLAIETRGPLRRLTWLGSDLCDYNAPLIARDFSNCMSPERFASLWRDIVKRLRGDARFRFDLVDLQKMPEAVGGQRNPFLDLPVRANPSGAYVATLAQDWEAYYAAKRSSATRKKERRQLKHLVEHGAVQFVEVRERADIERTVATLIEQKSRAFARMGVENLFERPGYRAFYLDIAGACGALTHVSRLDVGVTTAAVSLGLTFRDCYYLVLSSYHDGEISRFGPGRAHLHELLRHAIERGFRRFDFTIGDEPYKRDWSDIEVRLCDHLDAVTMRGTMTVALTTTYRRAKRFIKQTPALWHAYSKVRGALRRR